MDDDDFDSAIQPISKERPLPFSVEPEDIAWRLRDAWLEEIDRGYPTLSKFVLQYFEREAVSRFRHEFVVKGLDFPDIRDGYDDWLQWWWNEARHSCNMSSSVGAAQDHLSPIGQSAVNVLMASVALREAISSGNAEKAAALSMLLLSEALMGGYSLEFQANKQAKETVEKARMKTYRQTIGRDAKEISRLRKAGVEMAKRVWAENPTQRIGQVAAAIVERAKAKREMFPDLEKFPTADTVKAWLRDAAAQGDLVIPAAAQAKGRPPKS